jgi:hypothetical protein
MMIPAYTVLAPLSLGHLCRADRIAIIAAICQSVRQDLRHRGRDPQLMLLGAALDYCGSLLRDAGPDPEGDAADAARALLEEELLLLLISVRAAALRPDDLLRQQAAARVLLALFPHGELPQSLTAARSLSRVARTQAVQAALDRLGLRPCAARVEQALGQAELTEAACQEELASELVLRARKASRMADLLLRRLHGHVCAVTDLADAAQRERAAALLGPLQAALPQLLPRLGQVLAHGEDVG